MDESVPKGNKKPISRAQDVEDSERKRSSRYPRHNLKRVEELGQVIFNLGARNCDLERVAEASSYSSAQNGAFNALRSSASTFGLITYPSSGYVSLTEPWIAAFNSEDEAEMQKVRREAIGYPVLYRQLLEEYADRQLPAAAKLARELYLNTKYGIMKEAAELASQVFIDSVKFAGALSLKGYLELGNTGQAGLEGEKEVIPTSNPSPSRTQSAKQNSYVDNSSALNIETQVQEGDLDRVEIRLLNGKKAYLFLPIPLPHGEKERLKKFIDLLLEEASPRLSATQSNEESGDYDA